MKPRDAPVLTRLASVAAALVLLCGGDLLTAAQIDLPARLAIHNDSLTPIRGWVRGPGPLSRPFFVPRHGLQSMTLQAGSAVVSIDSGPTPFVRHVALWSGEVTNVEYYGLP